MGKKYRLENKCLYMENNALIMEMFAEAGRFRQAVNSGAGQDGGSRDQSGLGTC